MISTTSPASPAADTQESGSTAAPHGLCECIHGCQCQIIRGPAAFQVERSGKTLKVCTRCDLSGDRNKKLLVGMKDSIGVYMNYDPLGAMCIARAGARGIPMTRAQEPAELRPGLPPVELRRVHARWMDKDGDIIQFIQPCFVTSFSPIGSTWAAVEALAAKGGAA